MYTDKEIDAALEYAHFVAERESEGKILELLKIRGGKPKPDWDEDDLQAFKEIRKGLEMALVMKRAKEA
ncbi:hypothetical protein LCGC14_0533560 [marine sediment metagenome]|uniref:Uncharacterized protein n=1 Tax=marine sediment metagenome TaxID=412755 RepID=A0A0F9UGF6_9ZZZZ